MRQIPPPGERPTISPDFSQGAYDDELLDRYIKLVPGSVATAYLEALPERQEGEDLEPALRGLDVPLLLSQALS